MKTRGRLGGVAGLLLSGGMAWAQAPASSVAPMEWDISGPTFGIETDNREERNDSQALSSFENLEGPAESKVLASKGGSAVAPVVWVPLVVILGLVVSALARWLYCDNVFGRRHQFPLAEVRPRLGGSYSGGLGAVVRPQEDGSGPR